MNVKSVEKENGKAKVVVEIDKPEFEQALNKAYAKCRKDIMLPGFRKGKAPRKMVESMYGATVFYEDAVNEIFPEIYTTAIVDQQLKAVGSPSVSNMDTPDEGGVVLTIETELYPEVTLGQYKGIEVPKREVKVEESEVDAEVNRMAERNARIETVDRAAQMGDTVVIDFEGFEGGKPFQGGKAEDYSLTLGSGSFIPGFEEALVGAVAGEERDVNVTFPENYNAKELAGKPAVFKCKVHEVKESIKPELDDEFAKDNGFDTLDEYKADVKADLEKRKTEQRDGEVRADLMHKAIENMTVAVPEVMVKEKAEEIIRNYARNFGVTDNSIPMDKLCEMLGLNEEAMKTSIMPAAEAQVKNDLLLEAIVAAEGFAPTEEETEEYIAKTAEKLGAKAEELKQYFGVDFIAEEQKKEMASNIIFDTAIITEAAPEEKAEEKAEETEKEAE